MPLLPQEDMTLEGVRTGDTLHLRLTFQDNGDVAEDVALRLRYYTSKQDFEDDVNSRYVSAPGVGTDWEWWDGCAAGTWCDHGTRRGLSRARSSPVLALSHDVGSVPQRKTDDLTSHAAPGGP